MRQVRAALHERRGASCRERPDGGVPERVRRVHAVITVAGDVWDVRARTSNEVVVRLNDGRLAAIPLDELSTAPRALREGRPGHLIPEDPRDAGLLPVTLTIEQTEPVHLLANESRQALQRV